MRYLLVTLIVFFGNAIVVAACYFFISHQIKNTNLQSLQTQQEINHFGVQANQMNLLDSSSDMLQAKEQLIDQIKKRVGLEHQLLFKVASGIPQQVWLTEWLQDEQTITLNGYAVSNDILASFISTLAKDPLLASVNLASTMPKRLNGVPVYQFQLICVMGGGE